MDRSYIFDYLSGVVIISSTTTTATSTTYIFNKPQHPCVYRRATSSIQPIPCWETYTFTLSIEQPTTEQVGQAYSHTHCPNSQPFSVSPTLTSNLATSYLIAAAKHSTFHNPFVNFGFEVSFLLRNTTFALFRDFF